MKNLFSQALVVFALMLSPARGDAAEGDGLKPGTTFKLTVTERSSTRADTSESSKPSPIPAGIPDFKKGQRVKFTIGLNGQLKADGMAMALVGGDSLSTTRYLSSRTKNSRFTASSGELIKLGKNDPKKLVLLFERKSGGVPERTWRVVYVLK